MLCSFNIIPPRGKVENVCVSVYVMSLSLIIPATHMLEGYYNFVATDNV